MFVTFQNKLHETSGCRIYTRATLHFLCIFLCSSRTFDQSHDLMEADCAHKLPGLPVCCTTECEMGLFRQQAHKTPFYKHYLHYKFLSIFIVSIFIIRIFGDVSISWGSAMISFSAKQMQEIPLNILFAYSAKSLASLITHFFYFTCWKIIYLTVPRPLPHPTLSIEPFPWWRSL